MKETIKIKRMLQRVGVFPHLIGYHYLTEAIKIVKGAFEKGEIYNKYFALYDIISRQFNVSLGSVERAMRHAISSAANSPTELFVSLFGGALNGAKPNNACFISVLAEQVIFENEEGQLL